MLFSGWLPRVDREAQKPVYSLCERQLLDICFIGDLGSVTF